MSHDLPEERMSQLVARLRRAGLRATRPRILVLDVLDRAGGHLAADEVLARLRARGFRLSRATVYNVIHSLVSSGLVMIADTGPGRMLLEPARVWHHHFVYEDIVAAVIEKLVRRHPHVFGETKAESVGVVLTRWEQIKAAEREEEEPPRHVVPLTLPALARAQELVERLRRLYPERYEALRQHVAGTTPETTADTILQQLVSSVLAASEQALDAEAALRMWTLELERTHFGEASAYQSDG